MHKSKAGRVVGGWWIDSDIVIVDKGRRERRWDARGAYVVRVLGDARWVGDVMDLWTLYGIDVVEMLWGGEGGGRDTPRCAGEDEGLDVSLGSARVSTVLILSGSAVLVVVRHAGHFKHNAPKCLAAVFLIDPLAWR
jgi:hypothetical protein